jgi:hypothetical protein
MELLIFSGKTEIFFREEGIAEEFKFKQDLKDNLGFFWNIGKILELVN